MIAASSANGWTRYYKETGSQRRDVYTGTREVVLRSQVGPVEWEDWSENYESSAVSVPSFDDAVAKIFRFDLGYKDQQKDKDGFIQVVQQPTPGTERYFYSPNFCNKCSWWEDSTHVENLQLAVINDGTIYRATNHLHGIDMQHGLVRKEDLSVWENAETYPHLIPYVEKSTNEGSSWSNAGTEDIDYVIDYANSSGVTVTFLSSIGTGTLVRMSFRKANNFLLTIKAPENKRLKWVYMEVQAVKGFTWTDTILLEYYAYVGPGTPPSLVQVFADAIKGMPDVAAECTGSYAVLPAMGEQNASYKLGGWFRGFGNDLLQAPFKFISYQEISQFAVAEVKIRLKNNIAFLGEYMTLTPHCQEVSS